jgi:D-sedoheptulose 7-phosphate isomerase
VNANRLVREHIAASIEAKSALLADDTLIEAVGRIGAMTVAALRNGNKVLLAGNGGSAADAQHIAAEFVSRFLVDRPALAAIALTTDTSALTAIGNDYGFADVFKRQLEALARRGDVFVAISTSGNSANIIEALRTCPSIGVTTVGLCGGTGGRMADLCDHLVCVPSDETPRIQESHILIGHILCAIVEDAIYGR